jgi:osmotically-inducible protein OsmY
VKSATSGVPSARRKPLDDQDFRSNPGLRLPVVGRSGIAVAWRAGAADRHGRPGGMNRGDASMGTQTSVEGPRGKTDSQLQRDVLDELAMEPDVDAAHIGVSVNDGIVTLGGHVRSYVEKSAAQRAAKRVHGVKAVVDEVDIKLPGRSRHSDEDIAAEVIRALRSHLLVAPLDITATVRDGRVTLEGTVEWKYQKDAAEDAVRHVPSVRGVTNLIEVKPRVAPEQVKSKIEEALERDAVLDAGRIAVEVDGGKVTLRGVVRSLHQKEKAEQVAWSAPGVYHVENHLTVEP